MHLSEPGAAGKSEHEIFNIFKISFIAPLSMHRREMIWTLAGLAACTVTAYKFGVFDTPEETLYADARAWFDALPKREYVTKIFVTEHNAEVLSQYGVPVIGDVSSFLRQA